VSVAKICSSDFSRLKRLKSSLPQVLATPIEIVRNTGVTPRKPLQVLWEFITTVSTAIAFTTIGLGALLAFGLLLALPIVAILLIYQHLF
jgi:hypothetical protein